MKPESPLSAFRIFPILCLLLLPNLTAAQSAGNYCEASAAVKDEIKKVNNIVREKVPFKIWHARQIAMLQELLKKYPGDFHLLRRYQDARRSPLSVDVKPLLADYREQMEKNPRDPVAVYLYSRLLIGRNTKEAIELSNKVTEIAPDFPWTYLQLAEIYNYPNFRDLNKSMENLKQWISRCPKSMDGLRLISRSSDKNLTKSTAQSLRSHLETSTANDDLVYWEQLWTLEFKVKPVPEHAQLRKQIAGDLTRLRAGDLNSEERLRALLAGYKQIGDTAGKHFAEEEILRRMPASWPARNIVQTRFYDKHPRPKFESSEAETQAYDRALVQATGEWLKQWPDDDYILSTRLRSLINLEGSTADVEAAYQAYDKAHDRSAGYSLPPLENGVARFYLKRGYRLETIPAMLRKGLEGIEQIEKNRETSDLYPRDEDIPEGANLRYVRRDTWPLLAQAYARLKQPDKAREVLAQLADVVKPKEPPKTDSQKRSYASDQTVYWAAVAKVAEIEQRKLDALTAYQSALLFWGPRSTPKSGKKDEVTESAERLWKELGGTDQGWSAFLARHETSRTRLETAEIVSWDSKNTPLAAFELTDLQGRYWSLADLKGKVAFINLWATWCGPCREELPYVQKLREKLKDRTDVLVLTLNTDQEIGKVEPFMKENKYTFPVLLAQEYADGNGVNSIPRNWVVSVDGKLAFEGIGFGGDGEEWMKKAVELIEKVKAQP